MFALTTIFISLGFFEEGEGLGDSWCSHGTRAAFNFRNAIRIFTYKFTFGFRTIWFVAFPITFGFFTYWFTLRLRSLTVSDTVRLFANSDTLWAVEHFTTFIRAFNFTFGFFTFYITDGVLRFGTGGVTLGGFANWVTYCWAVRIVAFPRALRVAFGFHKCAAYS
jgi:hypothetical protein